MEARVTPSRRVSAPEVQDADSPTRVEEEAEEVCLSCHLQQFLTPLMSLHPVLLSIKNHTDALLFSSIIIGGGRGGRGGGDRGSSGGGGGVCYANQKGECNRGSACRFTH